MTFRIVPAGDSALIVEFEERIDPDVNARAISCASAIHVARLTGVRDVVPTYRSVAVYFDPLRTDGDALRACLEREAGQPTPAATASRSPVRIPVCYGGEFGPDLAGVASFASLSEFDVTRVVYRLLEGHYAAVHEKASREPVGAPGAAAPARGSPAPGRDPRGVIRIFNFIYREIRDEVAKQRVEAPFLSAANAALAGETLSPSKVLATLRFDPDGSLPEARLIEQYERVRGQLGSEPLATLRQALSDVMFFLLFQAGELLESRADEDLARRVKELLSTLEVD